jgi:AraC-like DNA-binding protein
MKKREEHITKDQIRDAKTFPGFPEIPEVAPDQLGGWLSGVNVTIISALEWYWPRHWIVGPRVINDSMFFWFEKGSGKAWFGDPSNVHHFRTGDLMLIRKGIPHQVEGIAGDEPHVYAVHFHAQLFSGIDLLSLLGFPVLVSNRPGAPYKIFSKQLVREFAIRPPGWPISMAQTVFLLLVHILRTESRRFRPFATGGNQALLPRLLPVLNWIDEHLSSQNLTVQQISHQVHISETHFRRLFHEGLGMSPVQFIRQRRIEHACTLLRTTEMPIKQIAVECGFAGDSFFSRVFHKAVQTTPAAYRKHPQI